VDFVTLKELCNFEKGSTGLAKAGPGDYPLVATSAARKTCNTYQFDTKAVCIPLVSSTGHGHASLNNVHYQEGKFALGTILVALTNKDENRLNIQFLHLYLSQLKDQILVPLMSGGANVALSVRKIQNVEIPLPSIERQREIVENFKSIVIEEGQLKSELTHQQTLLIKLRQQILQEAIEGKLTTDWRKQNPNVEPASKLLERIAAEKAQLVKEKKIKKQKPLLPISEDEKPFELPEGWAWCRIWDVAKIITSGSRDWAKYYSKDGAIFVTMGNLSKESYSLRMDKIRYVQPPKNSEGARTRLEENDLLISITGDVGNLGLIPSSFGEAYINQHTCVLRFMSECQNKYFPELMRSPLAQYQYDAPQRGIKNSFRLGDVGEMIIPLPPLQEQQAIILKVEKLFAFCDQLETQITQSQTHAEQLMQAVLKEAFQSESPTMNRKPETRKSVNTQNQDNLILFNPTKSDYDKRTLLAAEIVHQLHREPTLGHLKLQKLIYLCQKTEQMQLPTNFLQQAAGPYDPEMARSLDKQLKDKRWFCYQREERLKYRPLENAGEHRTDFDKHFAQQKEGIHTLINLFRKEKSDHMEIVATLYACWARLLQEKAIVSDEMIFERFYQWSEEKAKYPSERLKTTIEWMCKQGIVPKQLIIGHI